jgi:hypothetical protein
MKNRNTTTAAAAASNKAHLSDDEDDIKQDSQSLAKVAEHSPQLSKQEIERRQLENVPVIADTEISPAAYLFHN